MSKSANLLLSLLFLSIVPSILTFSMNSIVPAVNSVANVVSNTVCETMTTGLLCGTTVAVGHMVLQQLPAVVTIRPCSVFLASPHCCAQFCHPGDGGTCDADTGACFCNPSGAPKVCNALLSTDNNTLSGSDQGVMNICRQKCLANPNGCTKPAAATDGIVGTVCMCFC